MIYIQKKFQKLSYKMRWQHVIGEKKIRDNKRFDVIG